MSLLVHVGPPRTGTTSLQIAWQSDESGLFDYGGVRQPRNRSSRELSRDLHRLCQRGDGSRAEAPLRGRVLEQLALRLERSPRLLVSEEHFLIDDRDATHQIKLRRLGELLGPIHASILICLRDPLEGLASLYLEVRPHANLFQSFRSFLTSNQARVFDYGHLQRTVTDAGFENIRWMSFERLSRGVLRYSDVFDVPSTEDAPMIVPHANRGPQDGRARASGSWGLRRALTGLMGSLLSTPDKSALMKQIPTSLKRSLLTAYEEKAALLTA